jgi:hypothetical protein
MVRFLYCTSLLFSTNNGRQIQLKEGKGEIHGKKGERERGKEQEGPMVKRERESRDRERGFIDNQYVRERERER